MSTSLWQEIMTECANFTRLHACKMVKQQFDPNSFGDSLVVLDCPQMCLRFIRDRGQVFVDFASHLEPDTWWQLDEILSMLKVSGTSHNRNDAVVDIVSAPRGLAELCSWIDGNFDLLVSLLSPSQYPDTKRALLQIQELRKSDWKQ